MKPGSILVIGGAGYIGSVLVKKLLIQGYKVMVYDSLLYGREPIDSLRKVGKFELIEKDIRDVKSLDGAIRGARATQTA